MQIKPTLGTVSLKGKDYDDLIVGLMLLAKHYPDTRADVETLVQKLFMAVAASARSASESTH